MANGKEYFVVSVEDEVIQSTTYIVLAKDEAEAATLIQNGISAFKSETETLDVVSTEIKSIERMMK